MHNGLISDLGPHLLAPVRDRIAEALEIIKDVKDKNTIPYVKVLMGLKYDYEQISEYDKASETADEILSILLNNNLECEDANEMVLSCYDTKARCGDYESFCIALEWNRPIEKQFYIPRRRIFRKFGLTQAFQDIADGNLDFLCVNCPPRVGKMLSDDTPILTRNGWKKHGDLIPGNEVLNHKGKFVKVLATTAKTECEYTVTFSNGEKIDCHGNHEWLVYDRSLGRETVRETKYMIDKLRKKNGKNDTKQHYRFLINNKEPIEGEYKHLEVDPYTLGAWIGDGTYNNACITIDKKDFKKHIPEEYLTASLSQRLELLAGLLDTDGCLSFFDNRYSFSTTSETLKEEFVSLVSTFGWRCSVCKHPARISTSGVQGKHDVYCIAFNPTFEIPCRVNRKQLKTFSKQRRISIIDIQPIQEIKYGKCIEIEGGIYLAGKQLVPTHNSTIGLFFLLFMASLYPDRAILGNGHSTSLTQSFYNEILNICTNPEYRWHEIFPNVNITNKSAEYSWIDFCSNKRFHTLMFKSVDGGTTGLAEASNILYCDDLVKDVETANNPERLDKLFYTYTSTIQDRKVQRLGKDGEYRPCPEIHINTPWSIHDVTSRLIRIYGEEGNNPRVRIISIPCYDENGESNFMFDYGKGFDKDYYKQLQASEDPVIFSAKYLMQPIERDGRPFTEDVLSYYYELPDEEPDEIVAYTDVAHGGNDYLSMPIGYVYGNEVYIHDMVFVNKIDDDGTRPMVCQKLIDNKVQKVGFEENNGGKLYADLIADDLKRRGYRCAITTHKAPTNKSKLNRILACQSEIKGVATEYGTYRLFFKAKSIRKDNKEYNDFMKIMHNWSQKEGSTQKTQHDDSCDSLAGLITNVLNGNNRGVARSINANGYL